MAKLRCVEEEQMSECEWMISMDNLGWFLSGGVKVSVGP